MAVGNFKRQTGRRLGPVQVSPGTALRFAARSAEFHGPAGLRVACEDPRSWRSLQSSVPGAAATTTTTILTVLWPDKHHILDWRVLAAVVGLDIDSGQNHLELVASGSREQLQPDLERYAQVQPLLRTLAREACLPLAVLERALYLLSKSVRGSGMTWAQYGRAIAEAAPMPEARNDDGSPDDERDVPPAAP
jgi:hypothetical protein